MFKKKKCVFKKSNRRTIDVDEIIGVFFLEEEEEWKIRKSMSNKKASFRTFAKDSYESVTNLL